MAPSTIKPHPISVPESSILDLKRRLASTRWPEKETVSDWSQGVPRATIQDLTQYWLEHYDWRACEKWINDSGSFTVEIDGHDIQFLHIRSRHEHALPLLLLHGWPGSILEFRKASGPLTDPTAYGSDAKDAFHLIIPSMPGYGFSSKPAKAGTNIANIARLYVQLMEMLGYTSWVAQGGDFGADVGAALAAVENNPPQSLLAVHLNSLYFNVHKEIRVPSHLAEGEKKAIDVWEAWNSDGTGYFKQQSTRPQTVGYGLADSPVGQAAWIYEKLYSWTQHDGNLEKILTKDEMLDNIMMYWLTNTGASSACLYWEEKMDTTALKIDLPIGITQFPAEHYYVPRAWADRYYSNIVHWQMSEAGGHFAAWEVPTIFVREVRESFRRFRQNN